MFVELVVPATGRSRRTDSSRFDGDPERFGEQVGRELEPLLSTSKSNEQVMEWIEANVRTRINASNELDAYFVRALMTAVTSGALHKTHSTSDSSTTHYSLNSDAFLSRSALLHRYIDHKPEREAHALCALQLFDVSSR